MTEPQLRLYSGKVSVIAEEIVQALTRDAEIETDSPDELKLDIEAILREYLRLERQVVDEAKNRMQNRGLEFGALGKVKSQVAKERGAPQAEDALPYLIDQVLRMFFHSENVIEVYGDDMAIRQKITPIMRRHMEEDSEIDREVRGQIRNLQEGTFAFESEYKRVLEQMKRRRGLES